MSRIRLLFLWHMHQPFYKDLVTGQYRLPWVRLHALKDYYGMVKLLDEFPGVHQTFNLVPSLIAQLEDYVSGKAQDPFLEVAGKPASDLSPEERRFALAYLFQANPVHVIARYPRYQELKIRFQDEGEKPENAWTRFDAQDFTDLQVFSQLGWFDEFFLEEPDIAALVRKGRNFTLDEQRFVIGRERELMARVLPVYAEAAKKGVAEISTSPYYHPILPLLCDTDIGGVSTPGLKLPQERFRHPEDARTQLVRGMELHQRVFGATPRGAWPSEGSVSEEVLRIASDAGLEWLATDEGVLARSLEYGMGRDAKGALFHGSAEKLYRIYKYDGGGRRIYLLFRDRVLSDLIGFVYSGMPAREAAQDFIGKIKRSAQPVLETGRDAVVGIFLDGENAWEYYPQSGREFLRRLYDGIQRDSQLQAVTVSEAIGQETGSDRRSAGRIVHSQPMQGAAPAAGPAERHSETESTVELDSSHRIARLNKLVPGSWIHANFNVWIGAPEDNRSWDYLSAARDFYANYGMTFSEEQRALAFEEILIAEGSDWNWWYGPEHHSANDRDFDELYRKHLSNVYLALSARPPDYLAQPISVSAVRPTFVPQMAYIHPRVGAEYERYFDWIGAAMYTADRRSGAMHGKQFLLDSIRAGIDEANLYGRMDFTELPEEELEIRVNLECVRSGNSAKPYTLTLEAAIDRGAIRSWKLWEPERDFVLAGSDLHAVKKAAETGVQHGNEVVVVLRRNFEFKLPLEIMQGVTCSNLRLRFALWRDRLPLDALPLEGWIELPVVTEEELQAVIHDYSAFS